MLLTNVKSDVLSDGRMVNEATVQIDANSSVYQWRCVCLPDDGHDHEQMLKDIAERVEARDAQVVGLHTLIDWTRDFNGVWVHITDCTIIPMGPKRWDLYVSWLVESKNHVNKPMRHEYRFSMDHPKDCPQLSDIMGVVGRDYVSADKRLKDAYTAQQEFLDMAAKSEPVVDQGT